MSLEFGKAFEVRQAFSKGWEAVKKAPLPLLVGGLIMNVTEGGNGGGGNESGESDSVLGVVDTTSALAIGTESAVILGVVAIAIIIVFAFFLARCFVHGGYLRLQRQVLKEGSAPFGVLFSGGDFFVSMILYKLVVLCVWLAVLLAVGIPAGLVGFVVGTTAGLGVGVLLGLPVAIWLGLGLTMGEHSMVFEGKAPVDALKRSLELANGNRMTIFIYSFATLIVMIVSLLGLLLLCVGVLVTTSAARSMVEVGYTRGFLLHTGIETEI